MVRALNGGEQPLSRIEHLVADVWALLAKKDHPRRVALEAKAHAAAKQAKVVKLKTKYEKNKRTYGLR